MKVKICRSCHRPMNANARRCPSCGQVYQSHLVIYVGVASLLCVVLVGLLYVVLSKPHHIQEQSQQVFLQQQIEQQHAEAAQQQHEIEVKNKVKYLQQAIPDLGFADAKNIVESKKIDAKQSQEFQTYAQRWMDAVRLASATPREKLAGPVRQLHGIKAQFEQYQAPTVCTAAAKAYYLKSMQYIVDGFDAFIRDPAKNDGNTNIALQELNNAKAVLMFC